MKKILLIVTVLASLSVMAQKDAPASAKSAFAKAYPNATKVKWEKEDGNFEVTFEDKGNEMSAIYSPNGVFMEIEHEMKVAELPASVSTYMKTHYKGVTVKGAAKITKADGSIMYEAALKGKDVLFDANGKFVKEAKD